MQRSFLSIGLLVLIGFHVLVCFGTAGLGLTDPEGLIEALNGEIYDDSLETLALTLSVMLLLAGVVSVTSIVWLVRGEAKGPFLGALVGLQVFTVGTLGLIVLGDTELFVFDAPRGALMILGSVLMARQARVVADVS